MDNRETILANALTLFAARGYEAVGVQEVAEAAGVTKPTLYHYFGSKLGLLRALTALHHEQLLRALEPAACYEGDLPLTLERLARAYFDFARQNPVYYRFQLALYFAAPDSEAYREIAGQNQQQYELVERVFEQAVNQHGNMRGRQRQYAATFIGMLNQCIVLWLNGHTALDDALLYSIVRQFQHGIYS